MAQGQGTLPRNGTRAVLLARRCCEHAATPSHTQSVLPPPSTLTTAETCLMGKAVLELNIIRQDAQQGFFN